MKKRKKIRNGEYLLKSGSVFQSFTKNRMSSMKKKYLWKKNYMSTDYSAVWHSGFIGYSFDERKFQSTIQTWFHGFLTILWFQQKKAHVIFRISVDRSILPQSITHPSLSKLFMLSVKKVPQKKLITTKESIDSWWRLSSRVWYEILQWNKWRKKI